jgi:hypothetical protein
MFKVFVEDSEPYLFTEERTYNLRNLTKREMVKLNIKDFCELECQDTFDPESWMTSFGAGGYTIYHFVRKGRQLKHKPKKIGHRPRLDLPEDKIKELHKQGLGYKAIATQLKREGHNTSFMTVKRILDKS